ncbi:MAG TPA: VOC family protein [Mycobacteriales bacterium]|jgi:predicted enzyme related to lactoylglutathione lyase|nr:glyoxalase [Mycobacterium sp.]
MAVHLENVAVDCRDAAALGRFWAAVLGWRLTEVEPGWVEVRAPDDAVPGLDFLAVSEPKTVKNRLHLDLRPSDQAAEVARIEALGARRADVGQGDDVSWIVLADPEGNEFCVLKDRPTA